MTTAFSFTRQRQGSDFPAPAEEQRATEQNNKEFLERLECFKAEPERNSVPVDGCEPDGIAPEKVR
jgi:hypothetical protein